MFKKQDANEVYKKTASVQRWKIISFQSLSTTSVTCAKQESEVGNICKSCDM